MANTDALSIKAKIPPQTPNKSKPRIPGSCFSDNTQYNEGDYERIWVIVNDVVKTSLQCQILGYHESHWISYVVSPLLNLVSNLKRFDEDGKRIIALDM